MATLADKLLYGARPAELPIEQPVQFDLVLNARTATAIVLSVPAALRLRADTAVIT